ncbi:MAG: hypothetical protein JWL61_5534 [Gemmatimonadetes bacterium]|nr:hypothetical protein [Gemmatimonadota bacterium]
MHRMTSARRDRSEPRDLSGDSVSRTPDNGSRARQRAVADHVQQSDFVMPPLGRVPSGTPSALNRGRHGPGNSLPDLPRGRAFSAAHKPQCPE